MLNQWSHPAVRDLYWAINSPSLISTAELTHWQDQSAYFTKHLHQLNKDPKPLLDWLSTRLPSNRNARLGQYFECLWHFYFHYHPDYQIITHNLQVQSMDNITLGELDLVVKDLKRECVMHIELAVKFYLALSHLYRAELSPVDNLDAYIGPGLKDRLSEKYSHTLEHQLPLSSSPIVKSMGIHIDEAHAIFKGRLFLPWDGMNSDQHNWLCHYQLNYLPDNVIYKTLTRSEWFATTQLSQQTSELITKQLPPPLDCPIQIVAIDRMTNSEIKRFFVVPNDWEERAIESM